MGDVGAFYDDLADLYHLIFADWAASVRRQDRLLDRVIRAELGDTAHAVLDAACGIGTQAIGLALAGHRLHAADLSPRAVARARREAAAFGVSLVAEVADLRRLAARVAGPFDAVLAGDNALPHLLSDADLERAVANMAAVLRPGGIVLASIRDYDQLRRDRPQTEGPRVIDGADGRRVVFQVWDWDDAGSGYRLHQFLVREATGGWRTDHWQTTYRALRRAELDQALQAAGLIDIRWRFPDESGFYQPLVVARKP